jgi:oligoendopeptidase F
MRSRHSLSVAFVSFALVLISPLLTAQERTRATIPDAYKWNLAELYPSDEAWHTERARIEKDLALVPPFKGTLAKSAARLQQALDLNSQQDKALTRLHTYASLKADEDTRVATYQGMRDQVTQLGSAFGAEWAFFEPEVLTMDQAKVDQWIASTPGLKQYAFYLHDILRRKAHTLSGAEEALLARTAPMASGSISRATRLRGPRAIATIAARSWKAFSAR